VSFLDETGAASNLARTHGRSDRGDRCVGSVPQGHWRVMTAVAGVRLGGGLVAPFTIEGPVDGDAFVTYVQRVLVPTLRPGDVVVMDNLSAHKHPRVPGLIAAAQAAVLYLPPYSPDYNPIEMVWSKVKRLMRTLAARTAEALHDAFARAFAAVTPDDVRGCFRHCGYATGEGAPL
jgi:transposase